MRNYKCKYRAAEANILNNVKPMVDLHQPSTKTNRKKVNKNFDVAEAQRKHTRCSLDGTETKLLVRGSKPRIQEGFP